MFWNNWWRAVCCWNGYFGETVRINRKGVLLFLLVRWWTMWPRALLICAWLTAAHASAALPDDHASLCGLQWQDCRFISWSALIDKARLVCPATMRNNESTPRGLPDCLQGPCRELAIDDALAFCFGECRSPSIADHHLVCLDHVRESRLGAPARTLSHTPTPSPCTRTRSLLSATLRLRVRACACFAGLPRLPLRLQPHTQQAE